MFSGYASQIWRLWLLQNTFEQEALVVSVRVVSLSLHLFLSHTFISTSVDLAQWLCLYLMILIHLCQSLCFVTEGASLCVPTSTDISSQCTVFLWTINYVLGHELTDIKNYPCAFEENMPQIKNNSSCKRWQTVLIFGFYCRFMWICHAAFCDFVLCGSVLLR